MALLDTFFRRLVRRGDLSVRIGDGPLHRFGQSDPTLAPVSLRLAGRGTLLRLVRDPALGAGEAWMDGRLAIEGDDIRALVELVMANSRFEDGHGQVGARGFRRWIAETRRLAHQRNQPARSRRNVAHHYDLSGRLYDLFLDRDRQYSCAYFREPDLSLDEAQEDKKRHIAAKLDLKRGQRVLDIGCGWGGMALYLHRVAGVDVTGITLSEEQLKVARERAAAAGVSAHVRFELIDYRLVEGPFDRIVSVGMFEHVGVPQYETFFAKCRALLAGDGVMLLHTIGRMGPPGVTDAFTEKYVFPGGYSPALSEIVAASERQRMIVSDVETLRLHYALTIDQWYDRTLRHRAEIEALYDARFFRLWTFYLAGAAAAFRHGDHCNFQLQYIRDRHALPITRDYLAVAESRLIGR